MVKRKVRNNSGMEDHIVSLSSHLYQETLVSWQLEEELQGLTFQVQLHIIGFAHAMHSFFQTNITDDYAGRAPLQGQCLLMCSILAVQK